VLVQAREPPLVHALRGRRAGAAIELLLEHKATMPSNASEALHLACQCNVSPPVFGRFVDAGRSAVTAFTAEASARTQSSGDAASTPTWSRILQGRTPLLTLAASGRGWVPEKLSMLLDARSDVNAVDLVRACRRSSEIAYHTQASGATAACYAACRGLELCLRLLLDARASVSGTASATSLTPPQQCLVNTILSSSGNDPLPMLRVLMGSIREADVRARAA
jgi:hypothetical protein